MKVEKWDSISAYQHSQMKDTKWGSHIPVQTDILCQTPRGHIKQNNVEVGRQALEMSSCTLSVLERYLRTQGTAIRMHNHSSPVCRDQGIREFVQIIWITYAREGVKLVVNRQTTRCPMWFTDRTETWVPDHNVFSHMTGQIKEYIFHCCHCYECYKWMCSWYCW